ncbi:MAG TPA: hydroxyacylglutathione hydrolase [Prochlorococcaceae cyanobacterium Fu_MAG_50]|nr:hydroxyacylglutathione hydrolase [Prochlorococcaceae cyanobacterium Fu_MAG_50]
MAVTATAGSGGAEPGIIHGLPVLQDNIIWIWVQGDRAVVVDPSEAGPVEHWLKARGLQLEAVLQTHHHGDHTGGTLQLLETWPRAEVIAASADQERIPFQTISVKDADQINLLGHPVEVIDVAGHTRAHVAYYRPAGQFQADTAALFCGDTLFGAGCGRLFEGTAADMHQALQRLGALPPDTRVYCAHEYTEANLRWAHGIRPDDQAIKARLSAVIEARGRGDCSLPSSIAIEGQTNLFLRATTPEELAELRLHKDHW